MPTADLLEDDPELEMAGIQAVLADAAERVSEQRVLEANNMTSTATGADALSCSNRLWRWSLLALATLAPRLYLIARYDVELSNDGFNAVSTLRILQAQGLAGVPVDLIDRFLLHPLYMLVLGALRLLVPSSFDFYLAARLLSALTACLAVILMFEFTRRAYNQAAAWVAALLLAFVPTVLWEGVSIISSTLFLALYLAVWLALLVERYRLAAFLAFLATITRYEGVVLVGLVFVALLMRDVRQRRFHAGDWLVAGALACAFPLTLILVDWLSTGNPLQAIAANSMASIWLRILAPGDSAQRALFFLTGYPKLFPVPLIWIGVAGAAAALIWHRGRMTALLLLTFVLFIVFDETLVRFDLTTLEDRFLLYPALPFLVLAGVGLADAWRSIANAIPRLRPPARRLLAGLILTAIVTPLLVSGYRRADAGMRWLYNMHASEREVVDQLMPIIPAGQPVRVAVYGGTSGALDYFGRQRGLDLVLTWYRFIPVDHPEQFLLDTGIQYLIYPMGNGFAREKYPYLDRFEQQTHGPVTFVPLAQFTTSLDGHPYTLWAVSQAN